MIWVNRHGHEPFGSIRANLMLESCHIYSGQYICRETSQRSAYIEDGVYENIDSMGPRSSCCGNEFFFRAPSRRNGLLLVELAKVPLPTRSIMMTTAIICWSCLQGHRHRSPVLSVDTR